MDESWHLNKAVIVTIIFGIIGILAAMFMQTIYVTSYFTKMESRISALELLKTEMLPAYNSKQSEQDGRLAKLEDLKSSIAVLEATQREMIKRFDVQAGKMAQIIDMINNKH